MKKTVFKLTEKSANFLHLCYPLFGKEVVKIIERSLKKIPEDQQGDFIQMILHYCYTEQIEVSCHKDLGRLLPPVIEALPLLSVKTLQLSHPEHITKLPASSCLKN